jgi:hypothetical protein
MAEQKYSRINGKQLQELREFFGESLSEFGWRLARAVDPNAKRGYSRQYISGMEHDKPEYRITPEIESAFWSLAQAADDVPAGIGGAVNVSILAAPGQVPAGTYLPPTAQAVKCARPACRVVFVKDHPFRKYHHPDCRELHRQEKRGQRGTGMV